MPVDPEEVTWMNIPKPDILQFLLYFGWDLRRILHLSIRGDDDAAFFGSLDGICPARLFDSEVDRCHCVLLSKVVRQLVLYLTIHSLTIGFGFQKVFIKRMCHIQNQVLPFPCRIILLHSLHFGPFQLMPARNITLAFLQPRTMKHFIRTDALDYTTFCAILLSKLLPCISNRLRTGNTIENCGLT